MHFVKLVSGICGGFLRRPAASAGTCAVSGDSVMQASRTLKQAALAGFLALAFLVFGGASNPSAATVINCTGGQTPSMTIVIYNNSSIASGGAYNIYPVLFAGAESKTDEWMQACFQGTDSQLKSYPFPRASQYRMYVNCCATDKNGNPLPNENGISPGGSVTIALPLYSPIVENPDPTKPGQLIDWWQGGGINVYKAPSTDPKPPTVLQDHWTADKDLVVTPTKNTPTCGTACNLHFFSAPLSIPNWEPQQLIEFTLGAARLTPKLISQTSRIFCGLTIMSITMFPMSITFTCQLPWSRSATI